MDAVGIEGKIAGNTQMTSVHVEIEDKRSKKEGQDRR